MILANNPNKEEWADLLKRPLMKNEQLFATVGAIIEQVKANGDKAVLEYEKQFDKVELNDLQVSQQEIDEAVELVSDDLKEAILLAKGNIERFHLAQRFEAITVETQPGVKCSQRSVPIEKVGLYIPGGSAPLFSTVLMLAVPASIAGCSEIVLCTPPMRNGKVNPAVLFAAQVSGITHVFKTGGVQAIASMAYGTQSIPKVYKIFGPGNQYVMAAKQMVSLSEVAIDMPAGPSEVAVLADDSANPVFVAADLLSQAEHGPDSQAMLITTSPVLQQAVKDEVERQLEQLPRKEIAAKALINSKLIVVDSMDEAVAMVNAYAPEHLIIQTADCDDIARRIVNAGSVFIGNYACESAGDYASGTNHTLPTNGYAKAYNGVNLDSFCRKITYQKLTADGIRRIGKAIEVMAANEMLDAHRNAVTVRLASLAEGQPQPESFDLERLVRKNILSLAPYSCARNEFNGVDASVFLDANENPYNAPYNRYPDPLQMELKKAISEVKCVEVSRIFCGNGSDEPIDLLFRVFCEPRRDNVVAIDPTYGMYQVCADVNDIEYRKVQLDENFMFKADELLAACDENTKLIFICSPNNPTGNLMPREEVRKVIQNFKGIVVVDEAYGDFTDLPSLNQDLDTFPNLVVLQTLSKAWGCAAIRLGMAFASEQIIALFNKVKYPYNVNLLSQEQAVKALKNSEQTRDWIRQLIEERERMVSEFAQLQVCQHIYPTNANFFLAKVSDANGIYDYLVRKGIIVRNRHKVMLCGNCLRITIGTPAENGVLLNTLKDYSL